MTVVTVYDPPMCCSTGVCGPEVDPKLARFAGDLEWLRSRGVEVRRFNLAQEPGRFIEDAAVKAIARSVGRRRVAGHRRRRRSRLQRTLSGSCRARRMGRPRYRAVQPLK